MEEQLLLMNEMDRRFKIGDEIEGEILSIKDGQLQISLVGYKSDGVIPFKELTSDDRLNSVLETLKVGDTIEVKGTKESKKLIIKGIINSGGDDDEAIYTVLKTTQDLFGLEDKITKIDVSALTTPDNDLARKAAQDPNSLTISEYETWYCTAYVSSISYQLQEVLTDSVAKPNRQVAESEGTILNKTELLMLLICILSSFASALGISNLITASVIERSQEIGLIKAIGGTNRRIILLILTEIVLTGILGGIFGYVAGLGFTQIIGKTVFSSYIEPAVIVIPIDIALVFAVTIIGSIPAIRYLLTLKPTEVLHGR